MNPQGIARDSAGTGRDLPLQGSETIPDRTSIVEKSAKQ